MALLAERLSLLPGTKVVRNGVKENEGRTVNVNNSDGDHDDDDDQNNGIDDKGEIIDNGKNDHKNRYFKSKNKKQPDNTNNNTNNNTNTTTISNEVTSPTPNTEDQSEWVYGFDRSWKEKQKEMEVVGEDIIPVEVEVDRTNAQRWRRCIIYWCFQKDEVVGG